MLKEICPRITIACLLVLGGCSSQVHEANERYVLVASHTRIPYWQEAYAGLRRAGAELHVKVDMVGPERYDAKAEQEAFEEAVADKSSGILISPTDPNLMVSDIDSALQQGIPVVTIDSDAPKSKRPFFIGSDNYEAGRLGGQLLVKLLNGKGNVVMFTYPGQANMMDRRDGYQSVFENDSDIKVIQSVDIHGEAAVAYQAAKDLLASKQQVNAFVCLEAVACPEVGEAVKESNATGKVTIIAMDTDQRVLNWIQEGLVAATIAQKPYTMAYLGVKLLDDMHHQKQGSFDTNFKQDSSSPYPAAVYTGTFLVEKENLQSFMSQSQPKANPSPKP
ncbi:MAG: substrate-binding domain-containing protein [Acidobacteriaceae bacterium]|nr:substrate-binding domain-containing protein [Acidobacteriaceae bacterium]